MGDQKLFKHKTFNQQLSEVKISYFKLGERRIGEKDDGGQVSTSYLYSALEKWIDLDCTEDFSRIIKRLGGLLSISTLPQVLNRKDDLIKTIHDELQIKEHPSLNSLLEILIAFAKDLGDDFYPHFERTFRLLLDQLWTKNVEIIENVFLSLAYLFKILWKCMIKDIDSLFKLYSESLLAEQKRDYIVMFASQSFAFLLRKFETKNESYDPLLNLMFDSIVKRPSLINGIGYLLFEVVKGVKNQLNSSASVLLPELLEKQNADKYIDSSEVKQCISYFFEAIANYIDKNNVDAVWSVLLDRTAKQIANGRLINNLMVLQIMVTYKKCVLVHDPNAVLKLAIEIYDQAGRALDDESNEMLTNLSYDLIENKISILTVTNIHLFITSAINSKISHLHKLKFFEKFCSYHLFDRDVLPALNKFLNENCDLLDSSEMSDKSSNDQPALNGPTLNTLLKLILARRPADLKLKISQPTAEKVTSYFLNAIESNDLTSVWKYMVILPTIETVAKEELSKVLVNLLIKNLGRDLSNDLSDSELLVARKGFLIHQLQQSLLTLNVNDERITPELYIDYLEQHPTSLPVLSAFKLQLTSLKKLGQHPSDECKSKFESLFFGRLQSNLSHQHSQMRRIVLEILIHFTVSNQSDEQSNAQPDRESIFSVCLKIEKIGFSEPRECQRLINKLDYSNSTTVYSPKTLNETHSYKLTPVYHLLGLYYINYTPFWETIRSVLVGYAVNHKNSSDLWKIISEHIKRTDLAIYESKFNWISESDFDGIEASALDLEIVKLHSNEDRPDNLNHRVQLLHLLVSTPQLVEKFNRYIVQWFFQFLNNEIATLSVSPTLYTEDITRIESMEVDGEETKDPEEEKEEQEDDTEKDSTEEKPPVTSKPTNRPRVFQAFLKFLKVFSTIKNPLAIYEEGKLRSLYYQLLENKDTNVQKAAFDCLKTYRFSFLTPYIENIESLIDLKQFRGELVKFNFASRNSTDSLLQEPHRKDVIPVVMRIIYGKLLHNFTSSKDGLVDSKLKKKLIFRYVSDYKEEDIRTFIEIAFNRFADYFDLDYAQIDEQLSNLSLKSVVPCKQLYASLDNLSVILENLGATFPDLLTLFYKLIVIFLKYSNRILAKRESVKRNSLHLVKQVRANCFKCLSAFFKANPNHRFRTEDINVLFETDLNRTLVQLPVDSLNYINPQLRLFSVWSEQVKFFPVLGKLVEPDKIYPLKQMMTICENRKAANSVVELITKIIQNLLTAHLQEEQVPQNLTIDNVVPNLNHKRGELGASLLLPFTDIIINRFEQNMNRKLKNKKSFSQNLVSEIETSILLSIGKYVNNERSCFRLIKLLLSSLQRNIVSARNEEADLNTLNIVHNLSAFISSDVEFIISSLEPYFDLIREKNSRVKMCRILVNLGKANACYAPLSQMIDGLNAYSKKMMDTFDVEKQLDTFNEIKAFLNANDLEQHLLFLGLLIKNCVFFIKTSDDYVLKSECSSVLLLLTELILAKSPKLFSSICIDSLLLREIRHGLKCENDMIKQDFIAILRFIIQKGRSKHRYCEQMSLLSDEDDAEQDFWANIFSIQFHQRSKAVLKLLNQEEVLAGFPIELITMFIMPMVLNNVFDKNYSNYQQLKESSINLLGKLSKHLNWSNYMQMLLGHIKRLITEQEDHKTIIRVICSLLNNFSFDLSNVKLDGLDLTENDKQKNDQKNEDDEPNEQQITQGSKGKDKPEEILKSIVKVLLPKLHQTLNKLATSNMTYNNDKEKKHFIEDDEILRLPIAIAMVKLLNSMPKETNLLQNNIRNIILRIVNFLKSRAQSIRDLARSTLVTVLQIIGPYYLNYVLVELRGILKRGFMFHVLTFTIYSLLNGVSDQLRPLDIESCIDLIVEICNEELFSDAAEEKEIDKITSKTAEAKKTRSYDVYRLIGKYISAGSLVKVYLPLKTELGRATEHKVMSKIDSCLQKLCVGLVENTFIDHPTLFLFLHGSIKDTIPALRIRAEKEKKDSRFEKMQSLLIEPVNKPKVVKTNLRTNMHLMMLHYLQILHLILKRSKSEKNAGQNGGRLGLVEPFMPILVGELSSRDPQLIAMALRCLRSILLKYDDIQDADTYHLKIKNNIFILLNKYGSYIKGENLDMKTLCFKMMIVLLSRTKVEMTEDQLKILLFYCDQDILDDVKQAQAFALLNAILDRKLDCEELREMMAKLREVLIQSDIEHIRQRCRNSWFRYFLNYVIGNQLQANLLFFTRQLEYEKSNGRESVLRMFLILVKFCPNIVLLKLVKYSLIPLSLRIVNEENILCRKLTSKVLFNLLLKLPELNRTVIFKNIVLPWFESDDESIKQLSCHLLGLLCDVEKEEFIPKRAPFFMRMLVRHLEPDQYVNADPDEDQQPLIRRHDHLIFALLSFLRRQLKVYPLLVRDEAYSSDLNAIWRACERRYLQYPHLWIRVTAMQLIDSMLSSYSEDEILVAICERRPTNDYVLEDPIRTLWCLTRRTLFNLANIYDIEQHGELVTGSLTFLLLIYGRIEQIDADNLSLTELQIKLIKKMNVAWLIRRIVREIRAEIKSDNKQFRKRKFIYTWLREMIKFKLTIDQVESILEPLMYPLVRDLTDRSLHKLDLHSESNNFATAVQRAFNAVKKRIGQTAANEHYSRVLLELNRKRIKRKSQRAVQVSFPS